MPRNPENAKYIPKSRDPRSDHGNAMCSAEVFVQTWQTSASLAEVAKKLGYKSLASASVRATKYRRNGVPLKYFTQQNRMPWYDLAETARALLKPGDVTYCDEIED